MLPDCFLKCNWLQFSLSDFQSASKSKSLTSTAFASSFQKLGVTFGVSHIWDSNQSTSSTFQCCHSISDFYYSILYLWRCTEKISFINTIHFWDWIGLLGSSRCNIITLTARLCSVPASSSAASECRGNPRTPAQCPEPASMSHSSYWKQI